MEVDVGCVVVLSLGGWDLCFVVEDGGELVVECVGWVWVFLLFVGRGGVVVVVEVGGGGVGGVVLVVGGCSLFRLVECLFSWVYCWVWGLLLVVCFGVVVGY